VKEKEPEKPQRIFSLPKSKVSNPQSTIVNLFLPFLRLLRLFAAILLQERRHKSRKRLQAIPPFGNAETLNAGRAITNSKATSEAANRMDGVKTEMLKFHTALRTLLSSVPFPFQLFSFSPPLTSDL
jgi:hypothetical protein